MLLWAGRHTRVVLKNLEGWHLLVQRSRRRLPVIIVRRLDRAIKALRIDDEPLKLIYAPTYLAGRAKTWSLGLEMSDPYAIESLEAFNTRLN